MTSDNDTFVVIGNSGCLHYFHIGTLVTFYKVDELGDSAYIDRHGFIQYVDSCDLLKVVK